LWTTTKAAAISFSVNRLLKKKLEATIFGSAFESTLEFIQYYLPSRFFDPVDFIYIFLGSMIGANIDDFGSKVLNNLTRLKYE
jgi:glycopeptide antibiotics resistance protein